MRIDMVVDGGKVKGGFGVATALQSVTRNEERVAAAVIPPNEEIQEMHGGATTESVGQRHWSFGEQTETAFMTLPHSSEQISTEGIKLQTVAR